MKELDDKLLWETALRQSESLALTTAALTRTPTPTRERLESALNSATERVAAIILLGTLDVDFTFDLVDKVVLAATSHRDAVRARELLGRLDHQRAARSVPPIVRDLLADADGDLYRRLAELLLHLGLFECLGELCIRASRSDDYDTREVADDFQSLARPSNG